MKQYLDVVKEIFFHGEENRPDRTGVGVSSIFGAQMKFDISKNFPLLTVKKTFWRGVVGELFWMLSGSTNTSDLPPKMQHWWTPWADSDGSLGPTYGKQFRDFFSVDQLQKVLKTLEENPFSRRHIIALWNPAQVEKMNLPPCHGNLIQFFVSKEKKLSCSVYQRSADMFLGVPVNIAFYSLLTYLIANDLGYTPGTLTHTLGDAHIYSNHRKQVEEMLSRESETPPLPKVEVRFPQKTLLSQIDKWSRDVKNWKALKEEIVLSGYEPLPFIKAEVAV